MTLKNAERIPGLVVTNEEDSKIPETYKCSLCIGLLIPKIDKKNEEK
jgi:hypothetical protein